MGGPRLAFVAAIAVSIGVGAVVPSPSRHEGITTGTSQEVRDAEVPAPHIAGPFYPSCQQYPFDVNQFHSLSPRDGTGVALRDQAHTLQVCADGAVDLLTLGAG